MKNKIRSGLAIFILVAGLLAISWIGTVGIVKLITMCFDWTFSWKWATGIWLILCILSSTFKSTKN